MEEPDKNTKESDKQISYFTFIPSDRFPVAFVWFLEKNKTKQHR